MSYNKSNYIKRTITDTNTTTYKKYLKWINVLQSDDGHILPILINLDHIDLVSCVHCKCHTRAGVSGHINKSFECVTIASVSF